MALTKVGPAGIGSTPGTGYVIGDSFLHSTGLNATNAYYTGIVTSQSIRVLGDLQVDGTTTTLDTEVTSVDKLEVAANNTTVGVAITQSGSGDILNLYDGGTEVFSVTDGGKVSIGSGAWPGAQGLYLGDAGHIYSVGTNSLYTNQNLYYNSSWKYNGNSAGTQLSMVGGVVSFSNAPVNSSGAGAVATLTERLRIASDGKVGINTTTLTEQLEVDGDIRVRNAIKFREDNGTETGNISLSDDDNLTIQSYGTTGHITFDTGSSAKERVRIDSSGRVKIGTISDYTDSQTDAPVYIEMQSNVTDLDDGEGSATTGLVRISEDGTNNNRYHGIELRNKNSGDIRFLNKDVGTTDRGDLIIAVPDEDASEGTHQKITFNSMASAIQIFGKGGVTYTNGDETHTDIYIATKTGVTAVDTAAGGAIAGLIRFEDKGTNNNRYHGIELRNRNSGDARILNLDEGATNKSNLVFATDDGNNILERLRITSAGNVGINCTPSANDLASGASFGIPKLHVLGNNSQSGAYELLARFQSGTDADNTGSTIVLNHANDRGLALQGGRGSSNKSFGAIKSIDNQGRLSNVMAFSGENGQGVDNIKFYTGNATTTTERLRIHSSGATTMHVNNEDHETFRFTTQGVDEAKLIMKDASDNEDIVLNTGGNSWINGGNFGINENSPASTLVVRKDNQGGRGGEISIVNYAGGGSNGIGNEAALNFGLENSTYDADNGNAQIKAVTTAANAATDIVISNWSGSSFEERLRIKSDGNVGIASATPAARLDVYKDFNGLGAGEYAGRVYGEDAGVSETGVRFVTKGTGDLHNAANAYLMHGISNGTTRFVFGANGNVGINETSPSANLHVEQDNAHASTYYLNSDAAILIQNKNSTSTSKTVLKLEGPNSSPSECAIVYGAGSSSLIFSDRQNERLRITSGGQVNIGGNYSQTTYKLQVDGSIKGDYFTGENLSNRTGYKWGASGMYTLTLGGGRSGNASSFTMFEVHGMNNSIFFEIMINFGHAGGGIHGSYRRFAGFCNGYTSIATLEDSGNVNYGGGGGFTITKPDQNTVRVVWNGASSYSDAYSLACEFKTLNSGAYFKNVNSAFS